MFVIFFLKFFFFHFFIFHFFFAFFIFHFFVHFFHFFNFFIFLHFFFFFFSLLFFLGCSSRGVPLWDRLSFFSSLFVSSSFFVFFFLFLFLFPFFSFYLVLKIEKICLNFVTISRDSSYVKIQFLGPSRVVSVQPSEPCLSTTCVSFATQRFVLFERSQHVCYLCACNTCNHQS